MKHVYEELADILTRNDDYRVLRRIVPITEIGGLYPNAGRALLVDTETTSADPFACEITELAMLPLIFDRDSHVILGVGDGYHSFQETKEPIPEEITAITGITDADVFGEHIDAERVRDDFAAADVIIAHNAAFDRPIMERHFPKLVPLQSAWACSMNDIPWKKLGAPSVSLESIGLWAGYFYEAHRAMDDVQALAFLLNATQQFDTLMTSAKGPLYRVWADGSPYDSKGALKARGYKWRNAIKTWYRDVRTDSDAEKQWLVDNRHCRNPRVEFVPASERYRHE